MKRLLAGIAIVMALGFSARAQDYSTLDSLLTSFYATLTPEPTDEKCREFDMLIATCRDSLVRQHVATAVFEHYKDAKVMGEEAVAVHVFDNWFANGKVKMEGEFTYINAEMFANFNRSTLIGCDAPQVEMLKPDGKSRVIPEKGRSALLFFYDTSCAKCKLETTRLPELLKGVDFPVNLYAAYCGSDRKAWNKFRRKFRIANRKISVIHVWDPEIKSDYLKSYGVLATPKMYFMEPGGSIIGRRLDSESLPQMIPVAGGIDATYRKFNKNTE